MTTDKVQALLAQPPGKVNLAELSAAVEELEKQVAREETEFQEQRELLDRHKEDRDALRGYRNFVAHFSGVEIPSSNHKPARKGNKREAILQLLSDGKQRETAAIRAALIEQEVMNDSDAQAHTLQVTLSRLFRKGELERVGHGVYKRPDPDAEEGVGR